MKLFSSPMWSVAGRGSEEAPTLSAFFPLSPPTCAIFHIYSAEGNRLDRPTLSFHSVTTKAVAEAEQSCYIS